MIRKVFKTGNSMVISIPKESIDFLRLKGGSEVSVELDRDQGLIVIAPLSSNLPGIDTAFNRQVEKFIEKYRPALEALAKK